MFKKNAFVSGAIALMLTGVSAAADQLTQPTVTTVMVEKSQPALLAHATRVGTVDELKRITIAVYLKFRHADDLQQLLEDQKTPGSPRYEQYLSPAEFHQQYSPFPADVERVKSELVKLGFKIESAPAGGLFVTASGTVGQVKRAFHVSQDLYTVAGKTVRSHAEPPQVPASIAPLVLHIAGLDSMKVFAKPFIKRYGNAPKLARAGSGTMADPPSFTPGISAPCNVYFGAGEVKATLSPALSPYPAADGFMNCGYTPAQLRNAYGADKVQANGKAIRVGVVDLYESPTLTADLAQFSKDYHLNGINFGNFQEIAPPGLSGVSDFDACGPQGWSGEETLDVEAVHSMAPGADIVYVGGACDPNYPVPTTALYAAIDNRLADILTNSWGYPEQVEAAGQLEADNQEFEQAAAEGITVLFSSGDTGDDLLDGFTIASASWPAASPWVTAIGGTTMLLKDETGAKTEYGWGNYVQDSFNAVWTAPFQIAVTDLTGWSYFGGAGGGTSLAYAQPSYQKGVVPAALSEYATTAGGWQVNLGTPHRVVPDVALLADPATGFGFEQTYQETTPGTVDSYCRLASTKLNTEFCVSDIGGTSLASPLMAGVIAIVDSARLSSGKPLLGFLNPDLYKLGKGAGKPIQDVKAPVYPLSLIFEQGTFLALASINSQPDSAGTSVVEGTNSTLLTTPGYDNTTGLGTVYVPALLSAWAPGTK